MAIGETLQRNRAALLTLVLVGLLIVWIALNNEPRVTATQHEALHFRFEDDRRHARGARLHRRIERAIREIDREELVDD